MKYKRVVIKIGTNVITDEKGLLDHQIMSQIVYQVSGLKSKGAEIIMVSSGAMGAGRPLVNLPKKASTVVKRQMMAAVGQTRLMNVYDRFFQEKGYLSAQVLATKEDFRDRHHYLNMKRCMEALLSDQIVPIVNENDVISVDELMFTDNDELAGLLASMMQADALILLTSVDGVWDQAGKVIPFIKNDFNVQSLIRAEKSSFGRGGMQTKCRMARRVAKLGIATHIANGKTKDILLDLMAGKSHGTTFEALKKVSSLKRWIAQSEGQEKGEVWINSCAVDIFAAHDKAVSLLPVGITRVVGEFKKGDIIKILSPEGECIGLGLAQYDSEKANKWKGEKGKKPLIHYDYLIIH